MIHRAAGEGRDLLNYPSHQLYRHLDVSWVIFSYMWKNDRKTHASERNKNEDITFQQKYEFSSLFLRGLFDPYHDYLSLCTFVNHQLMLYVGMQ